MFVDMADFTQFSTGRDPKMIVSALDNIFTRFDALAERHGLEKIKTIGDSYMAAAGVPEPCADHAARAARMALALQAEMKEFKSADGVSMQFRVGQQPF